MSDLEDKFEIIEKDFDAFNEAVNVHLLEITKHRKYIEDLCNKTSFPVSLRQFSMIEQFTPKNSIKKLCEKYGISWDDLLDNFDLECCEVEGQWYNSNSGY